MAHKFAHKWTSYLYVSGELTPNGTMNMEKMKAGGELEDGEHVREDGTTKYKLTGHADKDLYLRLESDNGDTYEGKFIDSQGGKLIIFGMKHYPQVERVAELQQDDPPWVITKP